MKHSDASDPPEGAGGQLDERVEAIAEQLIAAINAADPAVRPGLREYALDLLRGGTEMGDSSDATPRKGRPSTNPIGLALLLGVLSVPMLLIFLPLGLMMAAVAMVLGLTGVAMTLFRR